MSHTAQKMELEGKWDQVVGKVKSKWGDLTDDDFKRVEGKYDQLVGLLKEKYGATQQEIDSVLKEE